MLNLNELVVSLAMYDEGDDAVAAAAAAAAAATAAEATAAAAAAASGDPKVFSQDEVNRFLADDRRKSEAKFVAKQGELEGAYKEALATESLSTDQRKQLESKLEDLQKTFRSKEQQLEHDKANLETEMSEKVTELEAALKGWESKYKTTLVDRALQDAAIKNDAFNSDQILVILQPMTKLVEMEDEAGVGTGEFTTMVDLPDVDAKTGEPIITRRTPEDAVKRMSELPKQFGNLFKSNVVSGVGSGVASGSGLSKGVVNARNLSPAQYMELRKSNPSAIGLK